jgi:hypothetical protein
MPARDSSTRLREVVLDLSHQPGLFREVALVETPAGPRLRIDGDLYGLANWLNLPLSQTEVEAIFDALPRAEYLLKTLKTGRDLACRPRRSVG